MKKTQLRIFITLEVKINQLFPDLNLSSHNEKDTIEYFYKF